MRRVLFVLLLVAYACACKRDAGSRQGSPAASVTPDPNASAGASSNSIAPPSSASAAGSSDAPAAPRTETTSVEDLVAPESSDLENPMVKIGKTVVWGVEDGEHTRVVAKTGDGKPKLLRRTSGKVKDYDAVIVNDDIVVAWTSELAKGGTQVVAVLTASSDLSKVTAPTTVAMVAAPVGYDGAHVAIAKNPRGGVIVAHQGPGAKCVLLGQPTDCVSFEVKAISASGVVTKLATQKLHGGPSPAFRMLDVDGKALAVLGSSMRGGRTLEGVVVTYDANDPKPAFSVPICGGAASYFPDLVRGASGEIVSVCLDGRYDNPKCVKPLRGDADRCLRVAAIALDGKDLAPSTKGRSPAVQRVECGDAGGARLVLEGGTTLELTTKKLEALSDFMPPACAK